MAQLAVGFFERAMISCAVCHLHCETEVEP